MEALLPVLLCSIQVVPFIEHTGQAEMHFAGRWQWWLPGQLQAPLVGLSRQHELVFCFLDLAQEDLNTRSSDVQAKAEKEKKEIESVMQPKDLEEKKAEEKKAAATEQKKRKPPSLRRPGEQVGRQQFISSPF